MRYLTSTFCLALSVLVAGTAWAQDEAPAEESSRDRPADMRRRIMEEFDADGDGELSDEERAAAREEMRNRRRNRAGQDGEAGPRGNRQRGERMRRGGAEGRRGGPAGPLPDPSEVFDRFDADGNGSLNRQEFMKLTEEMRPPGPPRGPRGPEAGPDGPAAPPEGRRRRFDRQRPLQNPEDADQPPRRRQGRPRLNDEDAQQPRGPRGRGQGARGPGGPGGPPNPDALFDRFDENGDGQLSRAEFTRLAERMQQMRSRAGQGQGGPRMGQGRGRGPGGPGGEEGRPRRRRPARPEFDDDVSAVAPNSDNSV